MPFKLADLLAGDASNGLSKSEPWWLEQLSSVSEYEITARIASFSDDGIVYSAAVRAQPESRQVSYSCTCPSPYNPCKHANALAGFYLRSWKRLLNDQQREGRRREQQLSNLEHRLGTLDVEGLRRLLMLGAHEDEGLLDQLEMLSKASTPTGALALVRKAVAAHDALPDPHYEHEEVDRLEERDAERRWQAFEDARRGAQVALSAFERFGPEAAPQLAKVCALLGAYRYRLEAERDRAVTLLQTLLPTLKTAEAAAVLDTTLGDGAGRHRGTAWEVWRQAAGEEAFERFARKLAKRYLAGDGDLFWEAREAAVELGDRELEIELWRHRGGSDDLIQAAALLGQESSSAAVEQLERAVARRPDDWELRLELCEWLVKDGRSGEALERAWQLFEQWPRQHVYRFLLEQLEKQEQLDQFPRLHALLEQARQQSEEAGKRPPRWLLKALATPA